MKYIQSSIPPLKFQTMRINGTILRTNLNKSVHGSDETYIVNVKSPGRKSI